MGIGANLINEPLPLLNPLPSSVKSSRALVNYLVDIDILPPNPIEYLRPPLFSPCCSHI